MTEITHREINPSSNSQSTQNVSTPLYGLFLFALLNNFGVWDFLKTQYYHDFSYYQIIYWMIGLATVILTAQNVVGLFRSPAVKQTFGKLSPFLDNVLQLAQMSQLGINKTETINRIQTTIAPVKQGLSESKFSETHFPSPSHLHSLLLPRIDINAVTTKNPPSGIKQAQILPILPPRLASTKNVQQHSRYIKSQVLFFGLLLGAFFILYLITALGGRL